MTEMKDQPYKAVLLDIEGTTTSISFVYEVLFPYARSEAENYLRSQWGTEDIKICLQLFRSLIEEDQKAGIEGVIGIANEKESKEEIIQSWVQNIHWQMDSDRKTTALKALQGRIWNAGYADGTLKGQVYDDVPRALHAWQKAEIPVYIYSSGSIAAQKLLFGGSTQGDLRPLLSGYFDTTTGPKREAASYAAIAKAIEVQAEDLLFVTDVYEEAKAAAEARVMPILSLRPGNKELPEHDFRVVESLEALL